MENSPVFLNFEFMEILQKAIDLLAEKVSKDVNTLKVVEECAELQEVLIKSLTKSEGLKPDKSKIIEEMGDVVFRCMVLSRALDIDEEVDERIKEKAEVMHKWALSKFK